MNSSIIMGICRKYTDLSQMEVGEIISAAKRLQNMANLFDADAFIDCLVSGDSGDAIVVAEAKPNASRSAYKHSVVGMLAKKENEPAVHRTLMLGYTTRFMKAQTQENVTVIQTVDPIYYDDTVIGVYIIERKLEKFKFDNVDGISDIKFSQTSLIKPDSSFIKEQGLHIADKIELGILCVNYQGVVVFCNQMLTAIYRHLGFVEPIVGSEYKNVCLIKEESDELETDIIRREIRIDGSYFVIKRMKVNSDDIEFIVTITDVTTRKMQEKALILRSVAFNEMHHRIKNNLQTIASLLRLQKRKIIDDVGKEAIDDSINRILAIASIHEIMLNKEIDIVTLIDIIENIKTNTMRYFSSEDFVLDISCVGGDFDINLDQATAIVLIINELLQNSIKYAFDGKNKGEILILARKIKVVSEMRIEISYSDNGIGFDVQKALDMKTMGLSIIKLMVKEKLKGKIKFNSNSQGLNVKIVF